MAICLLSLSLALAQGQPAQADVSAAEKLTLSHCGRCHVVGDLNKYGGIGSTPSFQALRGFGDWRERFDGFYALNPHPAFTQIEGVTAPFPANRPSPIAPLSLTLEQLQVIIGVVEALEPFE